MGKKELQSIKWRTAIGWSAQSAQNIRKPTGEQVENEQEKLAKGLAWNTKKFQLYTISNERLVTDFFA